MVHLESPEWSHELSILTGHSKLHWCFRIFFPLKIKAFYTFCNIDLVWRQSISPLSHWRTYHKMENKPIKLMSLKRHTPLGSRGLTLLDAGQWHPLALCYQCQRLCHQTSIHGRIEFSYLCFSLVCPQSSFLLSMD